MPTIDKTFPITGPINLQARLGHGSLAVRAVDDLTEVTVSVTRRGSLRKGEDGFLDQFEIEMQGPTLTVSAPRQGGFLDMFGGWMRKEAVDVVIAVPSGTAMRISTFTAAVVVDGRSGSADVTTGAASITMDRIDGDLTLRYGSGDSAVGDVTGSVTVRAGSGNTRIGNIGGDLHAGCGSGRVEVASVRGTARSRAGSGDASIGALYGNCDLASGSGTMRIGLPSGVVARLDVTTGSGRVNTDLPIEDAPRQDGPSITVRARTGSGNIQLFRAA